MKKIKYLVESASVNILLLLVVLSLVFYPNCGGSRIQRISEPPTKFAPTQSSEVLPYLKLHMQNGDLYVLENWIIDSKLSTVNGNGKLYNFNRDLLSEGQFDVPVETIVIAETNQIKGPTGTGVLAVLTVITGIFTVVCIVNPKACFGSCPTFYAYNGDDFIVQAEGFSSSISPSLEEKDIDALYRIKPFNRDFTIQLKNEAYETHVIRSANLLALPKLEGGRVFSTPENEFYQTKNIIEPVSAVGNEGDISEKLCTFDGVERFSEADSNDLTSKEIIELSFDNIYSDSTGIIIAARQTLLTTFLFYQSLAYMGTKTGDWLANFERNGNQFKPILNNLRSTLGNIDILMENEKGDWIKVGEVGETGPIATDIKIVPLKTNSNPGKEEGSLKVRLRMAKGLWRIDYAAIGELNGNVEPIVISPSSSSPQYSENNEVVELLTNVNSTLITYPGDEYLLNYRLPSDFNNYELFMESRGYYLEWMRNEWLVEENADKVYEMLFNPKQYYKDLAPQFKKIEAEMEETFWSSKYVYP
jgi:hypothetical protein